MHSESDRHEETALRPSTGDSLPMDADGEVRRLIEAARQGSHEAFEQLVGSCQDYLHALAKQSLRGRLRAKVAASSLVQVTLLQAWQHFRQFDRFEENVQGALLAWLGKILSNNVRELQRHWLGTQKRDPRRERSLEQNLDRDDWRSLVARPGDTPLANVLYDDEAMHLVRAMTRLPERYQAVIDLRGFQRQSFAEIGAQLGLSQEGARSLHARAIERLQRELGDDGDD